MYKFKLRYDIKENLEKKLRKYMAKANSEVN